MTFQESISFATFIIGAFGVIFTIYNYFRAPQEKATQDDLLLGQSIAQLNKDFANLRDNHVHTLDLKLDEANKAIGAMAIQITRLSTILEERLPRKKMVQY